MILADKIMNLRKKAGWSQEELAEQLNVTRQSVSKWEGARAVPDMEKVVQMSRIFGVSTDYLLKDEIEEDNPEDNVQVISEQPLRKVTMEEASEYLECSKKSAPKIAFATFLCVISPITLLLLGGLSETKIIKLTENSAGGIGLCVLLLLVASATGIFISCSAKEKCYDFLEKEPFETEYGVTGMVKEKKNQYHPTYVRLNLIGTVFCILAAVPLFAVMSIADKDIFYINAVCLLLLMVACGCYAFVYGGTRNSAMEKLLEEGDYTRSRKAKKGVISAVSVSYWLIVTAVFLAAILPAKSSYKGSSWIIWPIAGVLYGAVASILNISFKHNE